MSYHFYNLINIWFGIFFLSKITFPSKPLFELTKTHFYLKNHTSSVPKKKADNGFSRYFMLKDELNFDTIKFREMARPFIRYFTPLLNGPRNEKIGCKHYLK
jgi:hypothetical protein